MKRSVILSFLFIITLLTALVVNNPQPAVNAAARHANLAELTQSAQAQGVLRVIVLLDSPAAAQTGPADAAAVTLQQVQNGVLSRLGSSYDPTSLKRYTFIPSMALQVTPAGLAALAADPVVLGIQEDLPVPPSLLESVPLIGAPTVWASGYSGSGQTVVVIDTGVDNTHPFLAGKVVAEGCFSTTSAGNGSTSLCPGGAASSTAPDSALPYATGVCPTGDCDHGTHVAGIAVGKDPGGVNATGFSGVAKDATLIAIQVFSLFPGTYSSCGGSDCVLSYTSDQISALQYADSLRTTYNIAAVNMSLGGGRYDNNSQASCDSTNSSTKAAIDTLRGHNIATVIASGNNGYVDAIGAPACISSAVSVGSTLDGTPNSTALPVDMVTVTSNVSTYLNLFAPGRWITSSIPGNGYSTISGTSMAAPHVAGAWAVLKTKFPNATVTQVLNTFVSTGKPITDVPYNSLRLSAPGTITKPRIRLDLAAVGPFSISGQIVTSGAVGIAGVTVSTNNGLITTLTNASGNYSLTGLIEGSYTVTPSKAGYTFSAPSQVVAVGPSKTGINFTGTPTLFNLTGQVTLSGGGALIGVTLSDGAGHTTLTDVNGNYAFNGLPAGSYTVTPSLAEYTFAPASRPVTLGPSQSAINFSATRTTYTVSGQVTLTGGGSAAGVTISDGLGHSTLTNAGGNYTLSGLPSGSYTLTPSKLEYTFAPTSQPVTVGPSRTGINFSATQLTYTVSGRVMLSGSFPVPGALISDGAGHTTLSDANGNYTLSGLAAGSYTITPSKTGYSAFNPVNRLVVLGPSKTAVNFVGTTTLYSVSGKVTSNGTTGIPGVQIIDGLGRVAVTGADGNYTLSGLPADSYVLKAVKVGLVITPKTQPLVITTNRTGINFTGAVGGKWYFLPRIQK